MARRQVRNGAQVIDVCLQSSERDEAKDIPPFYENLIRKIKAPIMIDTTDPASVEQSLTYCQGKSIINSINLEDGEEKFERICPLIRAYGAAVVVGCIDEDKVQAQAFTRERKLDIAKRSCDLLANKYKVAEENVIIDPLVFPCATGDENYVGGAVETIEAIRLIKDALPTVKTILGISNISFGLPAARARSREFRFSLSLHQGRAGPCHREFGKNRAFREHSRRGTPARRKSLIQYASYGNARPNHPNFEAIQNCAGGLAPADSRSKSCHQPISHRCRHRTFSQNHPQKKQAADLPLDQRLANYIVEGSQDGLVADLDKKLAEGSSPLAVINGPLMAGMTEVGRLFNNNELIVAEVLQSAEAMKKAVSHLAEIHGKVGDAAARQNCARHRERRRSRHWQKSRGNYSRQQRL